MKNLTALISIGIVPLWMGCASVSSPVTVAPVGPAPGGPELKNLTEGSLQVYTARQVHQPVNLNGVVFAENEPIEADAYELAHTNYKIYDQDGHLVQKVKNSRGINDATPTIVSLPAGSYQIRAESRQEGIVTVPVVIRSGQTTMVNLQQSWSLPGVVDHRAEFVWLDGRAVGWRAK
jgi:hypothetical protein